MLYIVHFIVTMSKGETVDNLERWVTLRKARVPNRTGYLSAQPL